MIKLKLCLVILLIPVLCNAEDKDALRPDLEILAKEWKDAVPGTKESDKGTLRLTGNKFTYTPPKGDSYVEVTDITAIFNDGTFVCHVGVRETNPKGKVIVTIKVSNGKLFITDFDEDTKIGSSSIYKYQDAPNQSVKSSP